MMFCFLIDLCALQILFYSLDFLRQPYGQSPFAPKKLLTNIKIETVDETVPESTE